MATRKKLKAAVTERYRSSDRKEKACILDELSTAERFPSSGAEQNQARIGAMDDMQRGPIGPLYISAAKSLQISLVCFGVNEAREAVSGDAQIAHRLNSSL